MKNSSVKSTKDAIIDKSLSMINEGGMMDFRIDVLALSLNLSPGNITYHFAKKEDISVVLWQNFLSEFERSTTCISNILDIKQTFLIFREFCTIMYNLRGVVMFSGSDSRVVRDPRYNKDNFYKMTNDLFNKISELLYRNGYLYHSSKDRENLTAQTMVMRWWINKSLLKNCDNPLEVRDLINHNAILILFSLYNQMNEKAKSEFDYLVKKVYLGDV